MQENFNTPILFIIFNRPDRAQLVFNEIKKIKPKKLFVVADGPRLNKDSEAEKCEEARKIINQVDWDCEVYKNFSDSNLGCKIRVSSGINWFFENVEEGIILEDDCLPDQSFFTYCENLLDKYRYNDKIMMISGGNFQFGKVRGEGSYYFSKLMHIWGWASWRRAWQFYDLDMKTFPEFKNQGQIKNIWNSKRTQEYWMRVFQKAYDNKINTWDYQLTYSFWSQGGLAIIPNTNLVSNIGFGGDSTHTKTYHKFSNIKSGKIENIIHPEFLIQNVKADNSYCKNFTLLRRIVNKIKILN